MKAHLMFRNRDFIVRKHPDGEMEQLIADLELARILEHMSRQDKIVQGVCREALLHPLMAREEVGYRQECVADALENPKIVRMLYQITINTETRRKKTWSWFSPHYLAGTFSSAVRLLGLYLEMLMELRMVADRHLEGLRSEGFRNLMILLQEELDDAYFARAKGQIDDLKKSDGTLISTQIGNYLQGVHYVLRKKEGKGHWKKWFFTPSYTVDARDDAGAKDMDKRRERAINEATNALAQATDHLEGFFTMLRRELAFFIGCINLSETVGEAGMPLCMPVLEAMEMRDRSWQELYDVSLLLLKGSKVVGNDLDVKCKSLYLITGANQGGKTTFLRSMGQAQLMAQCGMFVGARAFSAPIRRGVFTHFKQEEDKNLRSGKLDEELHRMSGIVDQLDAHALVLLNESFAATNEREGSEISRQITKALVESKMEVFSVTHLFTYAASFATEKGVQFLRAERLENRERTFRILCGEPLRSVFGEDLYHKIFAGESEPFTEGGTLPAVVSQR